MKKKSILLILNFAFCNLHSVFSQVPLVKQWDYRYGGDTYDFVLYLSETHDDGFVMGGMTSSDSIYDKTCHSYGSIDFWILKTDANGIKEWDAGYGGTEADFFSCGDLTSDGGFIFGGYTESGIGGSKSQPNVGDYDYWIIKTDSLGNKLWDKTFGGTAEDRITSVKQTSDGGYILGGFSFSDISGDKSQNTQGESDYWIIKTDANGNKIWDKDFGGSQFEYKGIVSETKDHGYIVAGYSDSPVSGDKTQASWGLSDYWLVKIDSAGNFQWDKDLGGFDDDQLYSCKQTSDQGFMLGGLTLSDVGGDKTQPTWNNSQDFWVIKTDYQGNLLWQKDFGGSAIEDEFSSIVLSQDKGFYLGGNSYSPISGDKTQNNLGLEQSWVLKLDSSGSKLWDKTPLTSGHDEVGLITETREGCIVIANSTSGDIAGDKTQVHWGIGSNADYWIIKYCDSLLSPHAGFIAPHHICPGTCASFLNTSMYATSYQWNFPGANPGSSTDSDPTSICYNTPGTYDVSLIATSSMGSDTVTLPNYIIVYPYPAPQGITQNYDTLFAIAGATSYQWYFNGNVINGATDYFYVAPQSGNYNVVATDNNGCEVEAAILNVIASTQSPASAGSGSEQLEVFPNPVSDRLYVIGYKLLGTADIVSIYNLMGEKIYSGVYAESIDCRNFSSGVYILEVSSNDKIFRTRFVKQ